MNKDPLPKMPTPEEIAKMIDPRIDDLIKSAIRLSKSKWNVVVFRNTPWLLVQYYLGLYLERNTILVIREQDKYFIRRLKHPLLKNVLLIKNYGDESSKEVGEKIKQIVESYEKKEKK